jgi:hypothetical protein
MSASYSSFFNNNLMNECKWNIVLDDGTPASTGLADVTNNRFPKKWIAVIMDFSVDDQLVELVFSFFPNPV